MHKSENTETEQDIALRGIDGDIGISMSGGGFRAAAFHLGTLEYVNRLNLAKQINAISTVSGGTFTGTKYVLSLTHKQSFQSFFKEYYDSLNMTNLVADGLSELANSLNNVSSGRQDLIVSMAQVYSQTLFCKKDANGNPTEPYYFDDVLNGNHSIDNVILNATDFRSGLAFRFQKTKNFHGLIGNYYNHIDVKDAEKIRLSDIVAASSCFPGGFEPISFPYDFTWKGGEIPERVKQAFPFNRDDNDATNPRSPLALMDGGVFDNQGLQSLLMAEDHCEQKLDLVIISDVDQPNLSLYDMPAPGNYGGLTLRTILYGAGFFTLLCMLTLGTISYYTWQDWDSGNWAWERFIFLYSIPFIVTTMAAVLLGFIYIFIRDDVLPHIPLVGSKSWQSLSKLKLGQLRNMIKLRVSSLLTLTSSVFMKRIRSLVFGLAYGQGSDRYKDKRVSNLIYTLSPAKTENEPIVGIGHPSDKLSQLACVAFNLGTTLWFDQKYQQPCLIASGQASLCYNMIKLFSKRYGSDTNNYPEEVKQQYAQIVSDWRKFNDDPFFAIKELHIKEDWISIEAAALAVDCNWGMFEKTTPSLSEVE